MRIPSFYSDYFHWGWCLQHSTAPWRSNGDHSTDYQLPSPPHPDRRRCSVDILFKGSLEKLNLKNPCYNSYTTLLCRFTRDSVIPVGTHILVVIIGEAPLQQNIMTKFIVVDTPFVYNAILGRPFLSGIRGVQSIYHNVLKFLVGTEVGEVRGDQQSARICYAVSANPSTLAKRNVHVTRERSHRIA